MAADRRDVRTLIHPAPGGTTRVVRRTTPIALSDVLYCVCSPVQGCYPIREANRMYDDDFDFYDDDEDLIDGVGFADPGGNSALRAATRGNPRNLPCPNCGEPNRLTPADRARGYQCDACADLAERGGY